MFLKNKTIILGITGGIAAYKTVDLVSQLTKLGANVHVCLSKNASKFVSPLSLEVMSTNKIYSGQEQGEEIDHIKLADNADIVLIAPATANSLAKLANGLSDEMIFDIVLATKAPVIIAPAMNSNMWQHPSTLANLEKLEKFNYQIIEPDSGLLACGHIGQGRLPDNEIIIQKLIQALNQNSKSKGKILISAGATREAIDAVRFISNKSSGKMAFALAREALKANYDVVLVSTIEVPSDIKSQIIYVETADEMCAALKKEFDDSQALIMVAAVADYKIKNSSDQKLAKNELSNLELEKNIDILEALAATKQAHQKLIGFSVETNDALEKAKSKIKKKNLDAIIINNTSAFGADTADIIILKKDNQQETLSASKNIIAKRILESCIENSHDIISVV